MDKIVEMNKEYVPFTNCKLPSYLNDNGDNTENKFVDIAEFNKTSVSDTIMYTANYVLGDKIYPIFIKISDVNNKTTSYECKIYEYIKTHILQTGESTNFVSYLAHSVCDRESLSNGGFQNLLENVEKFNILITRKVESVSLSDYLIKNENLQLKEILTQLFYALYVLGCHRITHNDLHCGNILIETLPISVNLSFTIGEKTINITTNKILYIFDWDMAVCDKIGGGYNSDKEGEEDFYNFQCGVLYDKFLPNFDLYKILLFLRDYEPVYRFLNIEDDIILKQNIDILKSDATHIHYKTDKPLIWKNFNPYENKFVFINGLKYMKTLTTVFNKNCTVFNEYGNGYNIPKVSFINEKCKTPKDYFDKIFNSSIDDFEEIKKIKEKSYKYKIENKESFEIEEKYESIEKIELLHSEEKKIIDNNLLLEKYNKIEKSININFVDEDYFDSVVKLIVGYFNDIKFDQRKKILKIESISNDILIFHCIYVIADFYGKLNELQKEDEVRNYKINYIILISILDYLKYDVYSFIKN